jgi:hypothetical protein
MKNNTTYDKEVKVKIEGFLDAFMDVGSYTLYEGEFKPQVYWIGVFDNDDFSIQYDSLSMEHIMDVYEKVLPYTQDEDFLGKFNAICQSNYLIIND